MLIRMNRMRNRLTLYIVLTLASAWLLPSSIVLAQAPAAAAAPDKPITTGDIKAISGPSAADLAKGDPGGTLTGTVNDIPVTDSKAGLSLADVVNTVGQNRIAINLVWTLVTGYLVMFMQAGFAAVETGLCRAKNANHTYMMNFMVYGFGLFAYWVMGFAIATGWLCPERQSGRFESAELRVYLQLYWWQNLGAVWAARIFPSGSSYDVGVMVMFLFQMVFMDTATRSSRERQRNGGNSLHSQSRPSFSAQSPIHSMETGRGVVVGLPNSGPTTDWGMVTAISPGRA